MYKNIIKQIWKTRKSQLWLLSELFIVFLLLWYVVDFLFSAYYVNTEPKGYDTHNVYHVSVHINPQLTADYEGDEWTDAFFQMFSRIREYPGVESACYYGGTVPYEVGRMFQGYTIDSTQVVLANVRMVNKEFFNVFKVDIEKGTISNWDVKSYPRQAVMSRDMADNLFGTQEPEIGIRFFDYYSLEKKYTLGAIAARTKLSEYDRYTPFIYVPIEDWMLDSKYAWAPMVAIRISDTAKANFIERFSHDMRGFSVGPFNFSAILAYDEVKILHDTDTNNYIRTAVALISFFIFNITLGILGTFWFRTRKRKGEIAIRMALGASRCQIFKEMISEAFIMLAVAILPAIVVAVNLWYLGLTITTWMDATLARLFIGLLISSFFMALLVFLAVGYPAYQAMRVKPAENLLEE